MSPEQATGPWVCRKGAGMLCTLRGSAPAPIATRRRARVPEAPSSRPGILLFPDIWFGLDGSLPTQDVFPGVLRAGLGAVTPCLARI